MEVIVYVIIASILAKLWLRVYQNFIYSTLGYENTSWWVAFVFAILTTIVAMLVIFNYPLIVKGLA